MAANDYQTCHKIPINPTVYRNEYLIRDDNLELYLWTKLNLTNNSEVLCISLSFNYLFVTVASLPKLNSL